MSHVRILILLYLQLYGVDSQQRQSVELPEWPKGLCPETLLPSIQDLLKNMQRGLILECKHGDIMATRLCKYGTSHLMSL